MDECVESERPTQDHRMRRELDFTTHNETLTGSCSEKAQPILARFNRDRWPRATSLGKKIIRPAGKPRRREFLEKIQRARREQESNRQKSTDCKEEGRKGLKGQHVETRNSKQDKRRGGLATVEG